ncbi:MAG: DUF2339 domain-containing protein [Nitrospinota bacterium]
MGSAVGATIAILLFFGVPLTILIVMILNIKSIRSNRDELQNLKSIIDELAKTLEEEGIKLPDILKGEVAPSDLTSSAIEEKVELSDIVKPAEPTLHDKTVEQPKRRMSAHKIFQYKKINFEQQLGIKFPIWIGGMALVLAGFFLVKYSIDNNLLSPSVRVISSGAFAILLLYIADIIRKQPGFAAALRMGQSLAGAGIVILYISIFAAANLYHLIPTLTALIAMALVTVIAVILSLYHGMPIAIFGLVGGFLTPSLIGTNYPATPILFTYLFFVFAGVMVLIKHKNWNLLSIPTLIGTFAWVIVWISCSCYRVEDNFWVALFLIATSATLLFTSYEVRKEKSKDGLNIYQLSYILDYTGVAAAIVLFGVLISTSELGLIDLGLFGIIALGTIALAYFNERLYGFLPWFSMLVNLATLAAWESQDYNIFGLTVMLFGIVYILSSYLILWSSSMALSWGSLLTASSIGYYLLAYYRLENREFLLSDIPLFWGATALILSVIALYTLQQLRVAYDAKRGYKDELIALFVISATTFISLALIIELEYDFLPVAFAIELFIIGWVSSKVDIKVLKSIGTALALIFAILMMPQILFLIRLVFHSLLEIELNIITIPPSVEWPIFQLGLPAIMFILASYYFRKSADGKLVMALELGSILLTTIMSYYLIRHIFYAGVDILLVRATFFERGLTTNIYFIYGLLSFAIGRYFNRSTFSLGGIVLVFAGLFRIVYFDILLYNPLFVDQEVGNWHILNSLLLPFGLPLIWIQIACKELVHLDKKGWITYLKAYMLMLLFILVTLNIAHFFRGDHLSEITASNGEIYSYSIAWILIGTGLLIAAIIRQDRFLRVGSLAVMIIAVGKVFLYDASELEGLYRVFSFFGLGLTLFGLSYFYTRFVFKNSKLGGIATIAKDS